MIQNMLKRAQRRKGLVWTPQQLAIHREMRELLPGQALAIDAKAGTGKTTTFTEGMENCLRDGEIPDIWLMAFGSNNAKELQERTPGYARGMTFHSLAVRALGISPDFSKSRRLADEMIGPFKLRWPARQLADLGKDTGVGLPGGPEDTIDTWERMITDYGIKYKRSFSRRVLAGHAQDLFRASLDDTSSYDFGDALYALAQRPELLPQHMSKPPTWLIIDEYQDSNFTQDVVISNIFTWGEGVTRLLLVGDPMQAIFGWRGATANAFQRGVERFNAKVMPLTVTQRCSSSVVEYAQKLVPNITARSSAPEGSVTHRKLRDFRLQEVSDGDAIICRNNAPLLSVALDAITSGRKVTLVGKDMARQVQAVLKKLLKSTTPRYASSMFETERQEIKDTYADRPFTLSLALDDLKATEVCFELIMAMRPDARNVGSPKFLAIADEVLGTLFDDPRAFSSTDGIVLCTGHRSKGLEWDTVWHLHPEKIPNKDVEKLGGSLLQQEYNLDYVIRTRARNNLILLWGGDGML